MKRKHKKIYLVIASFVISAVATFLFLSACGYFARQRSQNRFSEPDYIRYYSQGYSFEPISNKTSLLLNIADDGDLKRSMIITLDKDKHTLDLLDIPCDIRFFADGFSGSAKEAYKTGIYKSLLSKALVFLIDDHITISSDAFAFMINSLNKKNLESLSEESVKSLIYDISNDSLKKYTDRYHKLLKDVMIRIKDVGALEVFSITMNTLLNSKEGTFSLEDIISFFNELNMIPKNKMNIHLFEYDTIASVLNESFRVSANSVNMSELSLLNEQTKG